MYCVETPDLIKLFIQKIFGTDPGEKFLFFFPVKQERFEKINFLKQY